MRAGHPSVQRLQAYTLGKCPEQEIVAIHRHLAGCASCMTVLDALPATDAFVLWLRRLLLVLGRKRP